MHFIVLKIEIILHTEKYSNGNSIIVHATSEFLYISLRNFTFPIQTLCPVFTSIAVIKMS